MREVSMFCLLSGVVAFVVNVRPIVPRGHRRLMATTDAPGTDSGVTLTDRRTHVKDEIRQVKIEMGEVCNERNTLLTKKRLGANQKRKLESLEHALDRLALKKAKLYRILAGEDVKEPREPKSFSASDLTLEHITFATGIDVTGTDSETESWDALPEGGPDNGTFSSAVINDVAEEWEFLAERIVFTSDTTHNRLIHFMLEHATFKYFDDLAFAYEFPVDVSETFNGTTYDLGGRLDVVAFQAKSQSRKLGAGRIAKITPDHLLLGMIVVEAKTTVDVGSHFRQLLAKMCTLKKKIRGKPGPVRGALSNGREWIFAQLDENNVLYKSDPITVGLRRPSKDALLTVLRFLYTSLRDARRPTLLSPQSDD